LGNTRGFYCISNSGASELQGIGQFLSPKELYLKELNRSLNVQKRIGKQLLLGSSNKAAILSTNIELRTDMAEKLHFLKDTFAIHKKISLKNFNKDQCQPHQKSMTILKAFCHQ
jgi:hypothetical protein